MEQLIEANERRIPAGVTVGKSRDDCARVTEPRQCLMYIAATGWLARVLLSKSVLPLQALIEPLRNFQTSYP